MKKQIFFLLTIILAITPACKQQHKRATLITAGAVTTATGITSAGLGASTAIQFCILEGSIAAGAIAGVVLIPAALLTAGIIMIIKGAQIKKVSEEIQECDQQENCILNESN